MADATIQKLAESQPAFLPRSRGGGTRKTPGGPIFIETNRRLRQALEARGYNVRYVEVSGARHDPVHWRFQLADGILYLRGNARKNSVDRY